MRKRTPVPGYSDYSTTRADYAVLVYYASRKIGQVSSGCGSEHGYIAYIKNPKLRFRGSYATAKEAALAIVKLHDSFDIDWSDTE